MTSRERVLTAIRHRTPDRLPMQDAPWETTIERWRREGLPENVDPGEYFDFDFVRFYADATAGFTEKVVADISFRLPERVIHETDDFLQIQDANGTVVRNWKHRTSTPEMIDFPVTGRDRWNKLKEKLTWEEARISKGRGLEKNRAAAQAGKFICFIVPIGYDYCQRIVGSERLLTALLEEPDWCREMFETYGRMTRKVFDELLRAGYHFDGAMLCDDHGYRNGLLFSNSVYQAALYETHQALCDYFHANNVAVILHSCGNVTERVPLFIRAGFDCLHPLEVKAGMDLPALKVRFGDRLTLIGGIDARNMSNPDLRVIEEEIRSKFAISLRNGGYIFHSDHSVPDDVSFAQYQRVIDLVRQYGRY